MSLAARFGGRDRGPRPRAPRLRLRRFDLALAGAVVLAALSVGVLASDAREPGGGRYRFALPAEFPQPRVPKSNPMSAAKVELGRRLFYDVRLSGNGTQSCGACHVQALAFTDGRTVAIGSTNELHPRNTPSLVNVAYAATLTWADPSLVSLEAQMQTPLFGNAPVEMGITPAKRSRILRKLRRDRWYAARFRRAFPKAKGPLSWTAITQSIAAFERTIISARSKYDRYLAGEAKLTRSESRGLRLFTGERARCSQCHGSFLFNDQVSYVGAARQEPAFHNTGLYNLDGLGAYPAPNRGVFEQTGKPEDMGRFRAPLLRNVALTAPYMHDGSVKTLEEAVAHYAAGGRVIDSGPLVGDGRANPFKDPELAAIQLSGGDQADLVAFLRTLSDRKVTTDRRFANPFAK